MLGLTTTFQLNKDLKPLDLLEMYHLKLQHQTRYEIGPPGPVLHSKCQQHQQLKCQQQGMKEPMGKDPFGEESPVDRPLVKKYSTKIKSSIEIRYWIAYDEGGPKKDLNKCTDSQLFYSTQPTMVHQINHQQAWCKQQNIHLD